MRLGIDVSNNNGVIDWCLVALSGVQVAVIKVSEGTDFHDDFYAANLRGARDAGLKVGAYHFGRPSANTGANEARFFANIVNAAGRADFYVLDQEDDRVPEFADLGAHTLDFLETSSELLGSPHKLYSSHGYMRDHKIEGRKDIAAYDLWLASWQTQEPMTVLPWAGWLGWQFTSKGFTPGVGLVDQSLWRMSI